MNQNIIFLIKNLEDIGIKYLNDPKAFIEYSAHMDDVNNNFDKYNPTRNRKILIAFGGMIADIMINKKFQISIFFFSGPAQAGLKKKIFFQAIIKELFIRFRKLNISLVFITQSYFSVPKEVRLNCTHYLIKKIHNKRELQNVAPNIQQILIINVLRKFTENVQENHILS